MGTLLFVVVLSNFIMGFALAVYLHSPTRLLRKARRHLRRVCPWLHVEDPPALEWRRAELRTDGSACELTATASIDPFTGAPFEWLEELKLEQPRNTLEAALHKIRAGGRDYLRFLVSMEELMCGKGRGEMRPGLVCQRLEQRGERWIEELQRAALALRTYCQEAVRGCDAEMVFEEQLHDQVYQLESVGAALKKLRTQRDLAIAARRFRVQIHRLAKTTYGLRDTVAEQLARRLDAADLLAPIPQRRAADIKDIVDFARQHAGWRKNNKGAAACLLTVDVDRFVKLNDQLGIHGGDQLIACVDHLLQSICGVTQVSRLHGQTMVVTLPGIGSEKTTRLAEKVRQTIEAATFEVGAHEVDFTVSCGVLITDSTETAATLLRRVRRTRKTTRDAGRNQTAVDDRELAMTVESTAVGVTHSRLLCAAVA